MSGRMRRVLTVLMMLATSGFARFTDCSSFAVMERLGIDEAFAFDAHFLVYRFGGGRKHAIRQPAAVAEAARPDRSRDARWLDDSGAQHPE